MRYCDGILLDSQTIYHNSIAPFLSEIKRARSTGLGDSEAPRFGPEIHTQFP